MTTELLPDRLVVTDAGEVVASVSVQFLPEVLFIQDFHASGPVAARKLIRAVVAMASETPIYFPLGDKGYHDQLARIMSKFGAKPSVTVWSLDLTEKK